MLRLDDLLVDLQLKTDKQLVSLHMVFCPGDFLRCLCVQFTFSLNFISMSGVICKFFDKCLMRFWYQYIVISMVMPVSMVSLLLSLPQQSMAIKYLLPDEHHK